MDPYYDDSFLEDLAEFQIPESEVNTATHNFSVETRLQKDEYCNVYKGSLPSRPRLAAIKWHNNESYGDIRFLTQCKFHSKCRHENIIPFIGFCKAGDKKIVVTEYASNGSLDHHLKDPDKRRALTWAKRLEICLGVAKGIKYLHELCLEEDMIIVVLRSLCSKYILLDENMQPKICFLDHSVLVPRKQQQRHSPIPSDEYLDPVYAESLLISPESYVLGIILFELMSGMLANDTQMIKKDRHYNAAGLEYLIDPYIRDQIDDCSFYSFRELAYKCQSIDIKECPTIDFIIKTLEEVLDTQRSHAAILEGLAEFQIPELEVNSATNDFSRETRLENYKYCNVYKGSLPSRPRLAAIKWHNNKSYGDIRFCTQRRFHSKCSHENIIPFIGFCNNDVKKKIVVTEYASNGSLDHHLKDPDKRRALTWAKRLEICLGVAKGLKYLQDHLDEGMIVLRSLCSKYILLDENMQPKICFLDNSVLVPRKQQQAHSPPYTFASDQYFDDVYLDPVYAESLLVSPEADVYSFGVVLFELMSGMLAYDNKIIEDVKPQHLIHLVRRYYDAGLEKLIDPHIREPIDRRSFYSFGELAYKCISLNIKERPTIDFIIKTLEEVLDTQKHGADSIVSHQGHPLFSSSELHSIKQHGRLTDRFQNLRAFVKDYRDIPKQFHHELDMMCSFQHENIIPFIGYCKESVEKNIVFEYATNGNLTSHLESRENMCAITWAQRLNICLGAARGLRYLHSGLGDRGRVIHRTFSSSKVLLDDNMEAKICGFGRSMLLARNQQQAYEPFWIEEEGYKSISDSDKAYMDPVYRASGIVMTEVDIYSFGLVMFELLAGSPLNLPKLKTKLREHYLSDPKILVDTDIRDQVESHSLHTYIELAYKCISFNLKDRPSMNTVVKTLEKLLNFQNNGIASTSTVIRSPKSNKLEDFKVPLDSIKLDTDIGCGNYGTVYKGELSEGEQKRTAAFKRLNGGVGEFRKELELIFSCIYHENVVRFIGYCDEEKHCDGKKEMIIVMEYAANGSLRNHLDEGHLSWEQRLKICLGAAKGLRHLHTGQGEDNKIIHRDVKSANILLDENLEAKICDFGLSRSTPAADTGVYAGVQGTNYYMDPIYRESGKLRTASDVYSFGVVLFEMLTGKLAPIPIESEDGKPRLLIHLVRRYKTGGIPDKLIDPCIKDEMDDHSLFTFQDIAYECISLNYKKRPTMDMVVDRIEVALEYHVNRRR